MFAASKSARSAAAGDNKFNYVTLLLNGDGTNGKQNNTFVDGSTNNFTITRNGTPTQGSFSPYGSLWSNYFNGSTDYITAAANTNLALGSGDFTVEFWAYLTANPSGAMIASVRLSNGGSAGTWGVYSNDGGKWSFKEVVVSPTTNVASATAPVLNTWTHVAIVRSGTSLKIYLNGVLDATGTSSTNFNNISYPFRAMWDSFSIYTGGYLSNFRIVKGTAVYTSNFTPSTTSLTAITNTQLLTCQSNRFRDESSNNFTITANGSPSVQRFSPFEPSTSYTPAVNGGSGYFNGSTDWLSTTNSSALQLNNTTAFTLECWLYPTLANTRMFIFNNYNQASPYTGYALAIGGAGPGNYEIQFWDGTTWRYFGVLPSNTWSHVAVCYQGSGTTGMFFVNGVQIGASFAVSSSINYTSGSALIGAQAASTNIFSGYITDLRLVKGTAVYTSAFTPPTAPLTAVTNTSLLLNYTNAGISDAAAANDLTTVGDAQVSTTVVKYGTASMKFDGTGDYLTIIDSPNLQLMAGDFTIEGWIYLAANGVVYGIVSKGTATTGWSVNVTIGNKLQFSYTLSNLTGATSLSASTWYHFAVVRSGTASGNLKVYLNGVADATSAGAVTDSFNQTSITYVGADRVATSQLNGYIDDLRITKGHARYTATFTPPTAALPTF